MGSVPVTVMANSGHRHDQSISLGIYDSDTAWQPDLNEAALRHAGSTCVVVFVEEHFLRVLAVHLPKSWCKYHLSNVAGKCHHCHQTTRLRKSDVGSYFLQFHVDYRDPMNGSFLYCWLHRDRLCGLVVRVSGYRYRGLGFDSQRYQIFWVVVGLERGPLSHVRSIEELLE